MVDGRFFTPINACSLEHILEAVGGIDAPVPSSWSDLQISGAQELGLAGSGQISLAANKKYVTRLLQTGAAVVVVKADLAHEVPPNCVAVPVENPHLLFVRILEYFYPQENFHLAIAPHQPTLGEPVLEKGVSVAAGAVIGSGAQIGSGSRIGPNAVIGPNVTIGRNVDIAANVSVECAMIGDNVTLQAGVRVGTEGFGWLDHGKSNTKIPQLGRVIIQSHVSIGANSTIDRGALSDTVIGEGTKIDNLVQIGHNCTLGRGCLIAATTGLSGGTHVGDGVLMGGGVGSSGHLAIGANSVVHGRAAVTKDWPEGSMLAGAPAQDIKQFWRELAVVRRLAKGGKR